MNRYSSGTIEQPEVILKALVQLTSVVVNFLDICTLIELRPPVVCWVLGSLLLISRPFSWLLGPTPYETQYSVCGLGIAADHAGESVALNDSRVGIIHDEVAHSVVRVEVIYCVFN